MVRVRHVGVIVLDRFVRVLMRMLSLHGRLVDVIMVLVIVTVSVLVR